MENYNDVDWSRGTFVEKDPLFLEFNGYLRSIGVNVAFVVYHGANWFSLFVHSVNDALQAKQVLAEKEREMYDVFLSLMKKYNRKLTGYAHPSHWNAAGSLNYIDSFEMHCVDFVARYCKKVVLAALRTEFNLQPRYLFSHSANDSDYSSLAGYVMILSTAEEVAAVSAEMKNEIVELCKKILVRNDNTGFCEKYTPDLIIDDVSSRHLYGYSRED
ncbi:MAG: hypothetical protein LBO63_07365 [Oscillospiraceae bacterium]|jgi:hypothetical protein|nr:hypothetical protein [Oscillospiraceae bacterium]